MTDLDPLVTIPSSARSPASRLPDPEVMVLMRLAGISEPLANRLAELAPPREAHTLMSALPLVMVAWADGAVDPREAERIVEFCDRRVLPQAGAGRQVLERWLTDGLTSKDHLLFAEFVSASVQGLGAVAYDRWRRAVLAAALEVAEAAGGFTFLISPVNSAERSVLARVESLLDPARYV
jgi:hypothetical protein